MQGVTLDFMEQLPQSLNVGYGSTPTRYMKGFFLRFFKDYACIIHYIIYMKCPNVLCIFHLHSSYLVHSCTNSYFYMSHMQVQVPFLHHHVASSYVRQPCFLVSFHDSGTRSYFFKLLLMLRLLVFIVFIYDS